jgi:hypothetical protein
MADEDDLDAFFDEIDEVEEEAKKEEGTTNKNGIVETEKQEEEESPPSKKARISSSNNESVTSSIGGSTNTARGTVVVSKKAVVASAPPQPAQQKETVVHHITVPEHIAPIQPPLPPPPPLPTATIPGIPIPIEKKNTSIARSAAGKQWTDETLADFPENDFRLFVGNLPKDITDAKLAEVFSSKYSSFVMARIIYDKANKTSKGYGFVSLLDPRECARAIREMDQSWLGSRPIKVKRSEWKDRDLKEVRKGKRKNKKKHRW